MTPFSTVLLSLLITFVVLGGITAFVSNRIRRSPSVSTEAATHTGVSFVVSSPGWRSAVLWWTGVFFVAVGCVLLLIAIVIRGQEGAGILGVVVAIGGFLFVLLSRGVKRARLEVTADSVWVYRWRGRPTQIAVSEISRFTALSSNNYGGVVARSQRRRLFSATRLMLGYAQLIEYLRTTRPDLPIPDASQPM